MAQSGREELLLAEFSKVSTDSSCVETLIQLCDEFTYSQPEKALHYFEQARVLSEKCGYGLGLARSYERAGNIYFHQGKKAIARDHYLQALKVNQQVGDYEISASIHYNLGNLNYETGEFDSVLYHADKAAEIFLENDDSVGFAATLYLTIGLYKDQGKYSLAMENGLEALGIFQRHGLQSWEIYTLNNIVDLYKIQGDYAQCLEMIDRILERYRKSNNRKFEAVALRYKGYIYIESGNHTEAGTVLTESLAIAEAGSFLPEQAKTLLSLGNLEFEQENYAAAEDFYRSALKINQETSDTFYEAVSYLGIGKSAYHLGNTEVAIRNLIRAEEGIREFGDIYYLRDIYLYMSQVSEKQGNYRESLARYKQYSEIRDSLLRAEKSVELGELTSGYEAQLKEEQIQYLQQEKEHVMRSRNNLIIIGLLLIFLAASVILFLMYRARKNRQLVEEKEEVDRMKSRFFSNISHEFRTPLTLILSPLYELKNRPDQSARNNLLEQIERNAKRLLALINQILDLSKLEAGKYSLQVVRDDLFAFMRRIGSAYDSLAAHRNTQFRIMIPGGIFPFNFDQEKLEMVVNNLLLNAFRFEPPDGQVILEVKKHAHTSAVSISVKNKGSFIPDEQLAHIFDRYYSGADSSSTGTGIGLALLRELVELSGGSIQARSFATGGTEFIFVLPENPITKPVNGHAQPRPAGIRETFTAEKKAKAQVPGEPGQPKLLVIEDHPELCEFIRSCMSDEYQVVTAENGRAGMDKAVQIIPDIILSDVMMPEMDGLDLCRFLKQNEHTSHIPIILLSARAGEEGILDGLRAYADDYLVKPFRYEELKQRMSNLLRTRNELRERYSRDLLYRNSPESIQPAEKVFLQKMTDILEKNISNEEFGVTELSTEIGMSRSQLHRKLMGLINMNASIFIRNYRLKKGRELLMHHAGTISEVAYMVGFNSLAYFTKCYREYFGVTPGEQLTPA
ncbi:MAG: tetratricopeptide repeat protein [Bacteroidales bacterium]|nr:tetratricopeptide repeat protein [Bacteroidales bacterium]